MTLLFKALLNGTVAVFWKWNILFTVKFFISMSSKIWCSLSNKSATNSPVSDGTNHLLGNVVSIHLNDVHTATH